MTKPSDGLPSHESAPILLMNTISVGRGGAIHDLLADSGELRRWVAAVGNRVDLTPAAAETDVVDPAAAACLVRLRDAIRRLAETHTQDPRPFGESPVPDLRTAIDIVNDSSALSMVWPEMTWDGNTVGHREVWSGGGFVDALTSTLARRTIELMESPDWNQLRACVAPSCAHFYVKNTTQREWCSPACGNRARVARHSQRSAHSGGRAVRR